MKIALPSNGDQIDSHFGNCRYFTIFTIDKNKEIIEQNRFNPPAGCGCKSNVASELADKGVSVMIAGNMGDSAVNELYTNGIKVVRGCVGNIQEVAELWLAGEIVDSRVGCSAHEGCGTH